MGRSPQAVAHHVDHDRRRQQRQKLLSEKGASSATASRRRQAARQGALSGDFTRQSPNPAIVTKGNNPATLATARTVTASSSNPFLRKGFRGQATDSGRHHGIASSPRGRATELTLAPAQRANSASGVTRQLARSIGPRMRFRSASSSRCRSRSRRRRPIAIHMASRPCASSRRSSRRNSRRR
jgi:hypothetical protein